MTPKRLEHNFFEVMKEEHRELVGLMSQVRYAFRTHDRNTAAAKAAITQLCDSIEAHFLSEEEGGYLNEAIEQAPHLAARAEALHGQHATLRAEVRDFRTLAARPGEPSEDWWQELETRFDSFTGNLLIHEAHEDDLVQEAFTLDLGTGD